MAIRRLSGEKATQVTARGHFVVRQVVKADAMSSGDVVSGGVPSGGVITTRMFLCVVTDSLFVALRSGSTDIYADHRII